MDPRFISSQSFNGRDNENKRKQHDSIISKSIAYQIQPSERNPN